MPESDENAREELVEDFLKGGPRSQEWKQWREALEGRLARLRKQRSGLKAGDDPAELDTMIQEAETQINALATEEIISEFVEAEIDLSLNTAEPGGEFGDFSENGHY